ncbi:hypothetical protein DM01DRAFT_320588 [Hesseltinella vesiculosa]|uniref:CNH domain-containing protein n=1 Tax=Hesseltinella vesiculosa TaxID=101127 RepID=A0A1X2GSG1_9FUNG|nr:hypothetical protein DM01DRAFT_320588 [Hesseltinella vesiculosa]
MVEMTDDQIPQLVTRLAVAVRKKLFLFIWKDTEFVEVKEWPIPDRVRTMAWVGNVKICLGFSSEYALMQVDLGELTELFGSDPSHTNGAPPSSNASAISTLNSLYNMSLGFRGGKPMVTKIPNNEMLLARDNISIFLGLDGTPTRKVGIEWTGPPEQIGYSYPYVIAILPKHVEVRNIQSLAMVQQIDLANAKFLNQGKLVYVATTTQIWRLTPYSFSSQLDQLVEKHAYEEAVSLLEQIDAVLVDNKDEKLRMIRTAYAHDLFVHGEYDAAMDLFQSLDTPSEEVIRLYPSIISGKLANDNDDDDQHLLDPDSPLSPPNRKSTTNNTNPKSTAASSTKEPVPLTGIHLHDAITCLVHFLADRRQKLVKRLQAKASSAENGLDQFLTEATLVDTTLMKAYMMTNDALVGPLLRVHNHCDVEECETILLEKKKFKEMVDLLGQQAEGPLRGVLPTIRYLQRLGLDHFDLVLHYSQWVLTTDPALGMDIFIDDLAEVDTFPRDQVLEHLASISDTLTIQYLEYIIDELRDETPAFHNRLAIAYLDQIKMEKTTPGKQQEAEKILTRLPLKDLFEERAILLSRIGQHDQALDIYVYQLKNYSMAEEYCSKIYKADPTMGSEMYLTLLRVYLQPNHSNRDNGQRSPLLEPALKLLAHHGSHINAAHVLAILPTHTPLQGLFPFFEKYIRESHRTRNKNKIVKNLLKAEQFQTEQQLAWYQSRSVKITEDRMCPQCNKRIGNSVFAVFPNSVVVHYSCKERYEKTQQK